MSGSPSRQGISHEGRGKASRMRDGYLRGALSRPATKRQMDVLAAFVSAGGSVPDAAELMGIRPSTVKRHFGRPASPVGPLHGTAHLPPDELSDG